MTDIVAFRAEKTPTAVADFLVSCFSDAENHLVNMSSEISELSLTIIDERKSWIDSWKIQLIPVARLMISSEKERLSAKIISIINIGKEYIVREELTPVNFISRLNSGVRSAATLANTRINKSLYDLKSLTFKSMKESAKLFEAYNIRLNILSPENVLHRGYSITSFNGKIIKDSNDVRPGNIIETKLSKGSLKSTVTNDK